MNLSRIFFLEASNILSYLPFELKDEGDCIVASYIRAEEIFFLKGEALRLNKIPNEILPENSWLCSDGELRLQKSKISDGTSLRSLIQNLNELREYLLKENLHAKFWVRPQSIVASGFKEGTLKRSESYLKELYDKKLMVAEKKPFLVDLWKSQGPYLVADENEHHSFIDGASQIASLAIGHNHKSRNAMLLRPELLNPDIELKKWDIYRAFKRIIKHKSQQENIYFVNSGAEAMETAIKACQSQYPLRRRILAFEGSFHGRTLLALHATYSPAKRIPFEIYKDLVEFHTFPENKTPQIPKSEPQDWLKVWGEAKSKDFEENLKKIKKPDSEINLEIEVLLKIKESLSEDPPLCVLIEPMQCEGGDRYSTPRFFRALRLLTRAYDVALVFDEVQTGFGLGGDFFWHSSFKLISKDGKNDFPDAIYQAKKSQIGFCATRFKIGHKDEISPASLHRGYIQAVEILEHCPNELEKKVQHLLLDLQKCIGPKNLINPRSKAYAFAFDLKSPEILSALVSKRFQNGLLFYPAGEKTARFRLGVGILEHELLEIFSNLYKCFVGIEKEGLLQLKAPYSTWISKQDPHLVENISPINRSEKNIWPGLYRKTALEDISSITHEKWDRAYHKVINSCPQILFSSPKSEFSLQNPPSDQQQLITKYKSDPSYTKLDLFWDLTRYFGTRIISASPKDLEKYAKDIDTLEQKTYEKERQATAQEFIDLAKDSKSIIHLALSEKHELLGISVAAAAAQFKDVTFLTNDPNTQDEGCLYSVDLTLDKQAQGKGLGFRLKCEQFIEAISKKATYLKSRNRYPEAKAMARLNLRLGCVVTDTNKNDYGGKGTALYQSLSFPKNLDHVFKIGDILEGSLKNKLTLSNFVSRHYVNDVQILSETLNSDLRHMYLASGRAETIDKSLRLLRYARPQAIEAVSFENSFFGQTTAASRSLGGPQGHRYFQWPLIETSKELEQLLKLRDSKSILGVYAESHDNLEELKEISALCKTHKIPFVLCENTSAFWQNKSKSFSLAGHQVDCDALILFAGHQLGVLAVKKNLFLEKPLMMISTWDGDEFSLACLKNKIIRECP